MNCVLQDFNFVNLFVSKFICKIKIIPKVYSPLGRNTGKKELEEEEGLFSLTVSEACSLS